MLLYYGRAKQRIGSVNTKQRGLKMSGCPSKVGKKGVISKYIAHRVKCNIKTEGCGSRKLNCIYGVNGDTTNNAGRAAYCKGPYTLDMKNVVARQFLTAWLSGGVGRINAPRFACKCANTGKGTLKGKMWQC